MKIKIIPGFIGLLFMLSCSAPKDIVPEGNVQRLNTPGNDIAPVQKPLDNACEPCGREFGNARAEEDFGIRPSVYFLRDLVGDKLVDNAEAITFLTDTSGFFSISHPPDKTAAQALDVPLSGNVGGTDIFEFNKVDGKYVFTNLGNKINTLTWDSDPAAVMDEKCNVLLIWSSDRSTDKGFSSPFSTLQKLDSATIYRGNSDLYYCFRINGQWGYVKNFAEAGTGINTEKNEETPFLTCMCLQPYLLFASNRGGDYDIYWSKLSVDFNNQTVTVSQEPQALPKNERTAINSPYKEYFPYVPSPLASGTADNYIYFSSDRFKEPVPIDKEKKTQLKNAGEFDIYKFKLPAEIACVPPKITYKVHVIDTTNPGATVLSPLVSIFPAGDQARPVTKSENPAIFSLKPGETYTAAGGSSYDQINCEKGVDRTVSHYSFRKISKLEPEIIRKDTVIEYNEIVRTEGKVSYDTVKSSFTVSSADIGKLETSPAKKIESIAVRGDSLLVTMLEINPMYENAKFDTVRKSRKLPLEIIKDRYDTTYVKIGDGNLQPSELTLRNRMIEAPPKTKGDMMIEDTIYVWPQYYFYPPCEWRYIQNKVDYRRNVPYFMTGFWEVNTKANLARQLNELKTKEYADASFIELQPKNNYFGYDREDIPPDKKMQRRIKYDNRAAEYRQFARTVDSCLNDMTEEIAQSIIPAFEKLDTKAAGAQNKLIIIVNGFSDIRPIQKGTYIDNKPVHFISADYDTASNSFTTEVPVDIEPGTTLIGENNDILSKLRTYFGYQEIINRLKKYEPFKTYLDRGEVLLPDDVKTRDEFDRRFRDAKIVFAIEGKQVDPTRYRVAGYVGEEGDFHSLDPIRRINVIVKRVEVVGGIIKNPDCCRPLSDALESAGSEGK